MTRLQLDPTLEIRSLAALLGIALALRREAQDRLADLARKMDRQGDPATAATLRRLADEAGAQAEAVAARARELGVEPQPGPAPLPSELASAWNEFARSSLLTPYRVLAQAVTGERLAFAFFSYVAARADDPTVREAAERLAGEALREAARLRRQRREAWHREHGPPTHRRSPASTPEELANAARPLLAEAALAHMALASAAPDPRTAELLRELAMAEADEAGIPIPPSSSLPADLGPEERRRRALMPLERLSELFEATATQATNERLLAVAQAGLARTVARLRQVTSVLPD